MRNVVYLRVSTDAQNEENQRQEALLVAPRGAEIIKEKGSAWSDNLAQRPAFAQIRRDVIAGEIASITVWDLDRLYRHRLATVEFMRLAYAQEVAIYSYRQKFLQQIEKIPSPWGEIVRDLLIQVLGWLAEEESEKRSDRVKSAYQRKVEEDGAEDWGRPGISKEKQREVLAWRRYGSSYREIKKHTGVSIGKISEICKGADL